MRRLIVLGLAIAVLLAVAACGKDACQHVALSNDALMDDLARSVKYPYQSSQWRQEEWLAQWSDATYVEQRQSVTAMIERQVLANNAFLVRHCGSESDG